jgi:hypothetical protein
MRHTWRLPCDYGYPWQQPTPISGGRLLQRASRWCLDSLLDFSADGSHLEINIPIDHRSAGDEPWRGHRCSGGHIGRVGSIELTLFCYEWANSFALVRVPSTGRTLVTILRSSLGCSGTLLAGETPVELQPSVPVPILGSQYRSPLDSPYRLGFRADQRSGISRNSCFFARRNSVHLGRYLFSSLS